VNRRGYLHTSKPGRGGLARGIGSVVDLEAQTACPTTG
jgi:hypothetical protein